MDSFCLERILVGQSQAHLAEVGPVLLHRAVQRPFLRLEQAARAAGFELAIASGFRSFDRQLAIWNGKATGTRPLYDDCGNALVAASLAPQQLLAALLRFSALPGASRHHWGTDFDVFDARALKAGTQLQLTPAECAAGGVMYPFHRWLDGYLTEQADFFRPYSRDSGGVSPEPWHLSYAPVARAMAGAHTCELLGRVLRHTSLVLADHIMACLPLLYQRYVRVPLWHYPPEVTPRK